MSDDKKAFPECKAVDHPNLQPGWGCCHCRTFNGNQRTECKVCQHSRCDTKATKEDDSEPNTNWDLN